MFTDKKLYGKEIRMARQTPKQRRSKKALDELRTLGGKIISEHQ